MTSLTDADRKLLTRLVRKYTREVIAEEAMNTEPKRRGRRTDYRKNALNAWFNIEAARWRPNGEKPLSVRKACELLARNSQPHGLSARVLRDRHAEFEDHTRIPGRRNQFAEEKEGLRESAHRWATRLQKKNEKVRYFEGEPEGLGPSEDFDLAT